jgi:hypothetical protein
MSHRPMTQRALRRLSTMRRTRPGRERIEILRLISPLRYDVLIRAQFLEELRLRDIRQPLTVLPEFAVDHPYFTWFKHVESARFFPELLDDPERLLRRYLARVGRAVATLRSYERSGFDLRHPVTVSVTPGGAATESGTEVSSTFHIKDGCHRLALLLISGRQLEPEMYRSSRRHGRLLDNTALLLRHMDIPDGDYARFLSRGFVPREYSSLTDLRCAVTTESPSRLSEFDQIVGAHDRARLDGR